jgi:hypothetical protein
MGDILNVATTKESAATLLRKRSTTKQWIITCKGDEWHKLSAKDADVIEERIEGPDRYVS